MEITDDSEISADRCRDYSRLGVDGAGYEHRFNSALWEVYVLDGDRVDRVESIDAGTLGAWVEFVRDGRGGWSECRYSDGGLVAAVSEQTEAVESARAD